MNVNSAFISQSKADLKYLQDNYSEKTFVIKDEKLLTIFRKIVENDFPYLLMTQISKTKVKIESDVLLVPIIEDVSYPSNSNQTE